MRDSYVAVALRRAIARASQEGEYVLEQDRVIAGRYRIVEVLGDGGMARVYKAVDERLGRTVAVKALHAHYSSQPEFVARFEQEARLAAGLSHPNIISIHDVGHDEGTHYIVMEYVDGETLKALIQREAPLPLALTTAIVRQIGLALDYAHQHGVIHRDIKPENIILTPARQVKVGDFGIARALDSTSLTPPGMVMGSISYFSPEQAQGQPATARSDLYATGILLYEMLTGQRPFVAESDLAVAMKHIQETASAPSLHNPHLTAAIDTVVLKAMAKDPAQRFASGAELAAALAREATLAESSRPSTAGAAIRRTGLPAHDGGPGRTRFAGRAGTGAPIGAVAADRTPRPPYRRPTSRLIPLLAALVMAGALLGSMAIRAGALQIAGGGTEHGQPTVTATARAAIIPPVSTPTVPAASSAAPPTATPLGSGAATATSQPAQAATSTGAPAPTSTATSAPTQAATATATTVTAPPTATAAPAESTVLASPVAVTTSVAPASPPAGTPMAIGSATPQPAPAQGHNDLHVTLTIAHGVSHFTPVNPTSRFAGGAGVAYAIARWPNVRPGHAVALQWTAPTGLLGQYSPHCGSACGAIYAEIPLVASGKYHVVFLLGATAIAHADFTVGGPATQTSPTTRPGGSSRAPTVAPAGSVAAQIGKAIRYANDVYMQVMNRRDASHLSEAFGPYLIRVNRNVVAGLQARRQHWQIALVNLRITSITMLGPDRASVGVTKTESAALYSDAGRLISDRGQYTVHYDDLVQRTGSGWIVQTVMAAG